jgi:hypothetical protein
MVTLHGESKPTVAPHIGRRFERNSRTEGALLKLNHGFSILIPSSRAVASRGGWVSGYALRAQCEGPNLPSRSSPAVSSSMPTSWGIKP